ncbi:hypothetical protein [Chryseobacterium vrystaatense]|uniref:Uncharacterized protein n=1 Tax=Chryseobacterium vrystaatense TaxID=307480 RepID=A0A1M4UXD6_9FLAO|nr:hypothetical protein [Chryseobacterium vrystaatense]SHE61338.1 hypothetical protein SAMN02787073_0745 [Chryseobacterium vrystaatense]
MTKEIFNEKFKQVFVPDIKGHNKEGKLKISKLLELITDASYHQDIKKHFGLEEAMNNYILIGNVDIAYDYVKYITEKFEYVNYYAFSKNVDTYIEQNETTKENEMYFVIDEPFNNEGEVLSQIIAKAEYDSVNMFYKDRELSKHINYLKKNGFTRPLENLNKSWETEFSINEKLNKRRNYRFVKESNNMYLRSITSDQYNEYGVAFSFVVAMLALHKAMQNDKGLNFSITSLSLNESKIDIIVSANDSVYVEEIESHISSSISIRNNDLGNKSLSFTQTLKITRLQNTEREIYIFPKIKEDVTTKTSVSHGTSIGTVLTTIDSMSEVIYSTNEFVTTFKGFYKTKNYDELRAKIEERLVTNNSPFKNVRELKDLFKRSAVQSVDNLAKLLDMCGRAEVIDMDFDLKFKLRYLISNVLLYGKNNLE